VFQILFLKLYPEGAVIFEFYSRETMGCCHVSTVGTAFVHALTAAVHKISMMSTKAKEKKRNWCLNFVLTCEKYSSAPSAVKPFVQTSF